MIAIKNDFKWIDSTVTGMGRGPGNLKTEDILGKTNNYLLTREFKKSKLYFNRLKNFYKWGPNKYYKFAAQKKYTQLIFKKYFQIKDTHLKSIKRFCYLLLKLIQKKFNAYRLFNSIYFNSKKNKRSVVT